MRGNLLDRDFMFDGLRYSGGNKQIEAGARGMAVGVIM